MIRQNRKYKNLSFTFSEWGRIKNGKLEIVPEEAEIVRRIFHSYVFEGKGCHTIANELNAARLLTVEEKCGVRTE